MKKGYRHFFLISIIVVLLIVTACSNGGSSPSASSPSGNNENNKTVVMKIGAGTTNDVFTKSMDILKEKIEAQSNGRIKVELYPSGQLGGSTQVIEQVSLGNVQMFATNVGNISSYSELLQVLDLPYLFPDAQQAAEYMNTKGYDIIEEQLNAKGLSVMAYWAYGPRLLLSTKEINSIDDLKSMKVRTLPTPVLIDQWNSTGASGVPITLGELFMALQQGTVDAMEAGPGLMYSGKYYELADYVIMEPNGTMVSTFTVSKKWLDELPEELRQIVTDVVKETIPETNQLAKEEVEIALSEMQANGIEVIETNPELRQAMINAMEAVHTSLYDRVEGSKEWVEQIKQEFPN